jgi:hypothetical protein
VGSLTISNGGPPDPFDFSIGGLRAPAYSRAIGDPLLFAAIKSVTRTLQTDSLSGKVALPVTGLQSVPTLMIKDWNLTDLVAGSAQIFICPMATNLRTCSLVEVKLHAALDSLYSRLQSLQSPDREVRYTYTYAHMCRLLHEGERISNFFASIESGYSTRAGGPEWNNKLEIEAKSSMFPSTNVIASLLTGRCSKKRQTW